MWSVTWEHSSLNDNGYSSSNPCVYLGNDQCVQRIGSTPRGVGLFLFYVDHECMLSMINVVSECRALLVR